MRTRRRKGHPRRRGGCVGALAALVTVAALHARGASAFRGEGWLRPSCPAPRRRAAAGWRMGAAAAAAEEQGQEEIGGMLDQSKAPIVEALTTAGNNIKAAFFFPGHKMGRGLPVGLPGPFAGTKGAGARDPVWQYDVPEIPEMDNLFAPEGPIKDAEELAAAAFGGSKRTWFLVNGSTGGVLAALLAAVRRHQQQQQQQAGRAGGAGPNPPKVLLPRNVHKSAINGLILAEAEPVFLSPMYDAAMDICHGVPLDEEKGEGEGSLAGALRRHGPTGEVAAVLLVSPTYHGAALDVARAVALCREHGVPLIMDEAHGAHLPFLGDGGEEGGNPRLAGALAAGADLVVQSTHKTLAAFSQSAMMHAAPHVDDLTVELVSSALQLVQSSSPNYLLLASLDAARWQLASPQGGGRAGLQEAQRLAATARERIAQETRLEMLGVPEACDPIARSGAFVALDPLRVTVHFPPALGLSGYDADEVLIEEHGVYAELPASRTLTFAFGLGTTQEDVDRLVAALAAVSALSHDEQGEREDEDDGEPKEERRPPFPPFDGRAAATRARLCGPREAYFAPSEVLATDDPAILGRASAETVCPYPPGIPVLLPGEAITADVLAFLKGVLDAGGSVTGCSDPTLGRLRVLKLD